MWSSKWLSVLSLIACLCLIGLLVMQLLEASYYRAAPSVWP